MASADHDRPAPPGAAANVKAKQGVTEQLQELQASERKFSCILVTPYFLAEAQDDEAADAAAHWLGQLPLRYLATKNARLHLWTSSRQLERALKLLTRWRWHYETVSLCVDDCGAESIVSLLLHGFRGTHPETRACSGVVPCMSAPNLLDEGVLRAALIRNEESRVHLFARTAAADWAIVHG